MKDHLLSLALGPRRKFYSLWNQIQNSDLAYGPLETKLGILLNTLKNDTTVTWPQDIILPTGIRFITMLDADYPSALFELPQPPLGLFIRGEMGEGPFVTVVGSRKPLPYSQRMTRDVVREWVGKDLTIVSGGAIGIDGIAHDATLQHGGKTVVVLGGGIMRPHPRSHAFLFQQIVSQGGALVSEYPPFFEAKPYTFPERNRIIAAIGESLFLAQAHEKSGSLGTARTALDLGREIFVLRPVAGDPNFAGSEALIQEGARCLISSQDLLKAPHFDRDSERYRELSETEPPLQTSP